MRAFLSAYQVEKAADRHTFSNARMASAEIGKAGWGILSACDSIFICVVPGMTFTFSAFLPSP